MYLRTGRFRLRTRTSWGRHYAIEKQYFIVAIFGAHMVFLSRSCDSFGHFFNSKRSPASFSGCLGAFQNMLRGFKILRKLGVWWWKWICNKILYDCSVK